MLQRVLRRAHSTKALKADSYERVRLNPALIKKYTGPNINVASHNQERRSQYSEEFSFWTTWSMGVEGFSHAHISQDMHPLWGTRNEWTWLLGFLILIPVLAHGRKSNEDGAASQLGTATNRYAKMNLDAESANLNTAVPQAESVSWTWSSRTARFNAAQKEI